MSLAAMTLNELLQSLAWMVDIAVHFLGTFHIAVFPAAS
jgi:hypothetical protein